VVATVCGEECGGDAAGLAPRYSFAAISHWISARRSQAMRRSKPLGTDNIRVRHLYKCYCACIQSGGQALCLGLVVGTDL
jgi:hypothetical protein